MTIWLSFMVVLFSTCSKEGVNDYSKIVGDWEASAVKYFIDGKEICLEEGQSIQLYTGETLSSDRSYCHTSRNVGMNIPLSFYEDGKFSIGYGLQSGIYHIIGNDVICNMYGEDEVLTIEDNCIVRCVYEIIITGYDTYNPVTEKKLDGIPREFKYMVYYSKVR